VLRSGKTVGSIAIDDVDEGEVVQMMLGRSLDQVYPDRRPVSDRKVMLQTRGLGLDDSFEDIDVDLREGEILGLAGLDGQGQRELFLALFGVLPAQRGEVLVDGDPVKIKSPRDAIDARVGISLIPEDRKTEGLFLTLPIATNMAIPSLGRLARHGWIDERRVRRQAAETAEKLNLDPKLVKAEAGVLSGGNQQKVVIGKWVLAGARFLLLYDPTRGVDIGTKLEIYKLVQSLAEEGRSLLMYSSDIAELVGVCDRVITMYRSRVNGNFAGDELTEENLLSAIVGHERSAA
jgi:ribose transport system ATP-binding protein